MRLDEFNFTMGKPRFHREDEIDYTQLYKVRQILGTDDIEYPNIVFDPKIPRNVMGDYSLSRNEIRLTPDLLKYKDKTILVRILSHELCHQAVGFLYWLPKFHEELAEFPIEDQKAEKIKRANNWTKQMYDEAHGPEWQKYANKVNAVVGPNFVTKTSDDSYDMTFKDEYKKKWWQFWKK